MKRDRIPNFSGLWQSNGTGYRKVPYPKKYKAIEHFKVIQNDKNPGLEPGSEEGRRELLCKDLLYRQNWIVSNYVKSTIHSIEKRKIQMNTM